MPGPRRSTRNVTERVGACLLWGFITCATAYALFLLVLGILLAVQNRSAT